MSPRSRLLSVLLFLILTRALLNIPALIGAGSFPGLHWLPYAQNEASIICSDPHRFPCIWARRDAEAYLLIAANGYSRPNLLAFFPGYPLLVRLLAFGYPPLMAWSGVLLSNLTFILASLLLWRQVKVDFSESIAWRTIVTLSLFPTSFYFSSIYAESLLLLFSVLVYVLSSRNQYLLAGLAVSLASLTRPPGILLIVIPLVEMLAKRSWSWPRVLGTTLISGVGLSIYGSYLWITRGSPLGVVSVQNEVWSRSIGWPWRVLWIGVTNSITTLRDGRGYALSFDLLNTLLFVALAILGLFFLKRSLAAYLSVCVLAFLSLHASLGSITEYSSMSRFVLEFFPGFIVFAILLCRSPRLGWVVWSISAVGLLLLTVLFARGRFIA